MREPVVREADERRGISAIAADLGVRGVCSFVLVQ